MATWDSAKRGREMQRSAVLCTPQIVKKFVARLVRKVEDGRRASKRPLRRPRSTPPSEREGSSVCWRGKTACCAYINPVGFGKFVTRVNVLRASRL